MQACLRLRRETQSRLADVSFHDFDFFSQEVRQLGAVQFMQGIERRGFLDNLFKAALRRSCAVTPDQQRDLADIGNLLQQVHKPDFPDEAGHANQKQVLSGKRFTHIQALDTRCAGKQFHRPPRGHLWPRD